MRADLKQALRLLTQAPGFSLLAILSLAVAIGINSGIFALIDAALFRPYLAYAPERVVNVFSARQDAPTSYRSFSHAEVEVLRGAGTLFEEVGSLAIGLTGLSLGDQVRRSAYFIVDDGYFRIHAVEPARGRLFTPAECRPGAGQPVVLLSHALWRKLGARDEVLGSQLRLNTTAFTVIGVMPEGFSGGNAMIGPEVWVPLGASELLSDSFQSEAQARALADPRNFRLKVLARLQPGLEIAQAGALLGPLEGSLGELRLDGGSVGRRLTLQKPSRFSFSTSPSEEEPVGLLGVLLLGMAGVVLLITCLNLANLTLSRGYARTREFAVRLAVGASRFAIVRQLLTEGLLLSLVGGTLGLWFAHLANRLLMASFSLQFRSLNLNLVLDPRPDGRVVLATFGFCLLATLGFGLWPALRAACTDLVSGLRAGSGEGLQTRTFLSFFAPRNLLVMAQIALSMTLLFAAGLFFRSALIAQSMATGFQPEGVLVASVDYTLCKTEARAGLRRLRALQERLRTLPGVEQVALGTLLPYGVETQGESLCALEGGQLDEKGIPRVESGHFSRIGQGYFAILGIPLLRGRDFTEQEAASPELQRVVIVDETLARRLYPDTEALGRRVALGTPGPDGKATELEIVGIVASHRHEILSRVPPHWIFVPLAQRFTGAAHLFVRQKATEGRGLKPLAQVVRKEVQATDPGVPLVALEAMSEIVDTNIGLWVVRLGAALFGVFGAVALVLSVVGVYGVKAFAVERRRREMGIRLAIGARPSQVFGLVLAQGVLQVALSVLLGLGLALLTGKLLSSILYRVDPRDPLVLGLTTLVLALTASVATAVPAARAARVDPMETLRSE